MAASIAMITSVTNAGWQLQSHRWADIFVDLVIAVVLLYLCTCAPSAARRGSELATRLAHVLLVLVFAGWQLLRSPAPLQHTFVAAPLHLCGDVLVSQLFMAASSLPMYSKLSILAVSSATHLFRPYLLEASQEALAIILAGLIGALYGEASTSALRALRQKVESSKARRQADSRLLHAIKGQCGSAAAVLREVARSRQAAAASTDDVQTDSIELELLPDAIKMLAQVSELCHKREAFVQLEEGTYQPAMDEVRLCDLLVNVVGRHARVDAPEKVIVDETILRLAVHEVATNATRYGQDGTPILVQAKLVTGGTGHSGQGMLSLSIRNSNQRGSPPLSPHECSQVFRKGFRIRSSRRHHHGSQQGNGLGLSTVLTSLTSVGGKVSMTSDAEHTTVHLLLPAAECAQVGAHTVSAR